MIDLTLYSPKSIFFAIICVAMVLRYIYSQWIARRLPPGPSISFFTVWSKRFELPSAFAWLVYADWQKIFGDIIYFNVFGNPLLVLNSASAAHELLENRSAIYSSRPVRTMQTELMGFDFVFSGMPYGPSFKEHRSLFQKHFQPRAISKYHPGIIKHIHTLIRNLYNTPNNLEHHLRRTSAAIIMEICYGHHVAENGDEYVALADEALAAVNQSSIFGSYMVDYLPWLKYVPSWMPGAGFKKQAKEWRGLAEKMLNSPFDMVNRKIREGTAEPCMMTLELEDWFAKGSPNDNRETLVKNVAAGAYAAAVDTTMSTLSSFFLAMVLHPEIQDLARAELDRVVPSDRLPLFSDRSELPVIDHLAWETMRWNPSVNIALAHSVTEDDEYRGYRIPKGTTVLANIWTILHDPQRYPDPKKFSPQRFADIKGNSEKQINPIPDQAFGFGRRICPGRFLAFDTIWIAMATILSVYQITRACDEKGNPIEPDVDYTPGLISRPKPFPFRLIPRAHKLGALSD
ncbi:cytochrome P450 family protein [Pleurotus pulmonarius]